MASTTLDNNYDFEDMDWQEYMRHRPPYPPKLYELIDAYHAEHHGQKCAALDLGAGVGVATRELLGRYDHVVLSDASERYVEQARARFAEVPADLMSFVVGKGEALTPDDLVPGPVDLVIAATALHWMNPAVLATRLPALLAPGGTFAGFTYGAGGAFSGEHGAVRGAALDACIQRVIAEYEAATGAVATPLVRGARRFDDYRFFEEDTATWTDVRRWDTLPHQPMAHTGSGSGGMAPAATRGEGHWGEVGGLGGDDFLTTYVDYAWLEGFVQNLAPPLDIHRLMAKELQALKEALGDEEHLVQWPFTVVLATRK